MEKQTAIKIMNQVLGFLKLNPSQFAREIDRDSPQFVFDILNENKKVGISKSVAEDICRRYPVFNKGYLLTGEGPLLTIKEKSEEMVVREARLEYNVINNIGVPYYEDLDVTGSIITSLKDYKEIPTFLIDYRHFNDCDAYLPVVGDSMLPKFVSGDIIAVKQMKSLDTLLWGETYLVITNDNANNLRTIKDVHCHPDDTKVILRACNPEFRGDTIINKCDIVSIYIVKGKIKRNQL